MSEASFEAVIARLWLSLGLGAAGVRPGEPVRLLVDGLGLALSESPDGRHVVVSGAAGRLSADPWRQSEQVRRLMRDNLGLLLTNRAGLRLVDDGGGAPLVEALAVGPCRTDRIDLLTRLVEDVLQRLEWHGPALSGEPARGEGRRPAPSLREDSLIFRP